MVRMIEYDLLPFGYLELEGVDAVGLTAGPQDILVTGQVVRLGNLSGFRVENSYWSRSIAILCSDWLLLQQFVLNLECSNLPGFLEKVRP